MARVAIDARIAGLRARTLSVLLLACHLLVIVSDAAAGPAGIDCNGRITVDGRPVFLHGMYHDSMDASPARYGPDFLGDAEQIADAGFNTMWVSLDPSFGQQVVDNFAFLYSRNIHVINNFSVSNPEAALPAYAGIETLISLSTADDFNYPANAPNYRPDEITARRRLVEQRYPELLTIASGGAHPVLPIAEYAATMDAMGLQCYPISNTDQNVPGGEPYELETCDDMFTYVRNELGSAYPILPTLQAFQWYWDGARYPTPEEVRNMLFTTLQFAPAGVLWYSYYDGGAVLAEEDPSVWQELSRLATELRSLEPWLVDGRHTKVSNPDDPYMRGTEGAWHAAYWELATETYLIVTNTDRDTPMTVDFALPGHRDMRPVFHDARYASSLTYVDGHVRGTAQPDSVHLYVMTKESDLGAVQPTAPQDLCIQP